MLYPLHRHLSFRLPLAIVYYMDINRMHEILVLFYCDFLLHFY